MFGRLVEEATSSTGNGHFGKGDHQAIAPCRIVRRLAEEWWTLRRTSPGFEGGGVS